MARVGQWETAAKVVMPAVTATAGGVLDLLGLSKKQDIVEAQRKMVAEQQRAELSKQLAQAQKEQELWAAQAAFEGTQGARTQQVLALLGVGAAAVTFSGLLLWLAMRRRGK